MKWHDPSRLAVLAATITVCGFGFALAQGATEKGEKPKAAVSKAIPVPTAEVPSGTGGNAPGTRAIKLAAQEPIVEALTEVFPKIEPNLEVAFGANKSTSLSQPIGIMDDGRQVYVTFRLREVPNGPQGPRDQQIQGTGLQPQTPNRPRPR